MTEEKHPLTNMDIQQFRLSDGSEIIGYINSIEGAMILMERPMLIGRLQNQGEMETYFFQRFMPFAGDAIVRVSLRNIIATCKLSDDLKERYVIAAIQNQEDDELSEWEDSDDFEDLLDEINPMSKTIH